MFNIAQVHLQLQRGAGEADQLPPGAAPPLGHIRLLHLHTVHEAGPEQGLCSGLPAVWKVDMDEKQLDIPTYIYIYISTYMWNVEGIWHQTFRSILTSNKI